MSHGFSSSAASRFLRYVTFDTQSDEQSESYPSTAKQLVLLKHLAEELKEMGIADAAIDQYGYVMATIPATPGKAQVPAIGFVAHVDTSPEVSGAGVKPIVHKNYDGRDLVLPDDPSMVLREADNPELAEQRGNDIITASGLTLLGSDDKSGVAEIMAAAEHLMTHPDIPHGPIKIGFTPDEEVGRGTQYFDVSRFGARFAYTLDGPKRGELEIENFSADAMTIAFKGFNAHPGVCQGAHGERHQAGVRVRAPPPAKRPLAGDDRRLRGLRASPRASRAASSAPSSSCCCAISRRPGSTTRRGC